MAQELQFSTSRKAVVTNKADNCECRVTVTAYLGRSDTRMSVIRCTPRHGQVTRALAHDAEAQATKLASLT